MNDQLKMYLPIENTVKIHKILLTEIVLYEFIFF